MEIFRSLEGLSGPFDQLVVALGNFDGVHLGHQFLIKELVAAASARGGTAALLTFDPHPLKILQPDRHPPFLLGVEDKIQRLASLGVQALFLLPFSREFAKLDPEEFVRGILVEKLGVAGVIVGYNYSFGHLGQGDPALLEKLAGKYNFFVRVIPPVSVQGTIVSSTVIRQLIHEGQVEKAAAFLGYAPFLKGRVLPGDQRGRQIGFPTANLELPPDLISPGTGVYVVQINGLPRPYGGVANIGTRPTFLKDNRVKNLEVHIFDLHDDIYGQEIQVTFLTRLRGETSFATVAELVNQIQDDIRKAKVILGSLAKEKNQASRAYSPPPSNINKYANN